MKFLFLEKTNISLIEGLKSMKIECHEGINLDRKVALDRIHLYDGIVIRSKFYVNKEVLNKAKNLKFIIRIGAGIEHIDIQECKSRNIKCISSSEGSADAVAEHTICLMLCLLKNIFPYCQNVKHYKWKREEKRNTEISNLTLSIIGYGNTGRALAKKTKSLNMNVLCHDIKTIYGDKYAKRSSLDYIFKHTDILSLNIPLKEDTINYLNNSFISKFKKPFYIINSSRGKVIDENALIKGIKEKKILAAGLDVFSVEGTEFNIAKPKLASMENVIITPHIASYTDESEVNMSRIAIDKLKRYI